MKKDTVVITLPRNVALWLLVHHDMELTQLTDLLHDDSKSNWHSWATDEIKYCNNLCCCLSSCLTPDEILYFCNNKREIMKGGF